MSTFPGYVEYLDFSFGTWEKAYLVTIDEEYAHILDPFTYEWVKHIGKEHWISDIRCNRINAQFFKHRRLPNPDFSWQWDHDVFTNLVVQEHHAPDLFYISLFILQFKRNHHQHFGPTRNLEDCIDYFRRYISPESMDLMLRYYIDKHDMHKERLLLLLSPSVQRHLLP